MIFTFHFFLSNYLKDLDNCRDIYLMSLTCHSISSKVGDNTTHPMV